MAQATLPHFYTFVLNSCPFLQEQEWLGLKESHFIDSSGCITWYLTPRQEPRHLSTLFLGSRKDQPRAPSQGQEDVCCSARSTECSWWILGKSLLSPTVSKQTKPHAYWHFYFSIISCLPGTSTHNPHHYLFYYWYVYLLPPYSRRHLRKFAEEKAWIKTNYRTNPKLRAMRFVLFIKKQAACWS